MNASTTVLLVGTTGRGKSATGNSILRREAFESKARSYGITRQCEMQSTTLTDGRILNVIDTPGLLDYSDGSHFVGEEIVKCMKFAQDGIHAVIVVLSVGSRFSREEEVSINSLEVIFGKGILDHMILVFTRGDDLEADKETLKDYLGCDCPKPLQRILELCKHRTVLFNNVTKDESKRLGQFNTLLYYVDEVIASNGGKPYSDEAVLTIEQRMKTFREEHEKRLAEERAESDKAVKTAQEKLDKAERRALDAEMKLKDVSREKEEAQKEKEEAQKEKEEFRKYEKSLTLFLNSLPQILGGVAAIVTAVAAASGGSQPR